MVGYAKNVLQLMQQTKLIFASHNANKTAEIAKLLPNNWLVNSLNDIAYHSEIIEDGLTLQANALIKARTIFEATQCNCFADDTGLMVDALNGNPGVLSARFAGPEKNSDNNNKKLLQDLAGQENRKAHFSTFICLILDGNIHFFEGRMDGQITLSPSGGNGFGYDPIFMPVGSNRTLAEMSMEEKNAISHRAKAFEKMKLFLENLK